MQSKENHVYDRGKYKPIFLGGLGPPQQCEAKDTIFDNAPNGLCPQSAP